jgi:Double zinc ribbon
MTCPRCQVENRDGARFCRECGATFGAVCSDCGAKAEAGSKFCDSCGAPLVVSPAPTLAALRFSSPDSYTPKHLAEKILTSKAALEGERKQVTVLFADLKGSMALLADRDPEEARKFLDPVLEHMMEAVHRYEGTVNPGDGRRDHGALRRAGGPRGSRGARVLRGPRHAGGDAALHGGDAPRPRDRGADPRGPKLGRGRGARHQE